MVSRFWSRLVDSIPPLIKARLSAAPEAAPAPQVDPPAAPQAVQHAALVLDLCSKSKTLVGGLFEPPENEVESIRLRAHCSYTGHQHEMIVAQTPQYTLIVLQGADDGKDVVEDDDKE